MSFWTFTLKKGMLLMSGKVEKSEAGRPPSFPLCTCLNKLFLYVPVRHLTPASCSCVQELFPLKLAVQFISALSLPLH